jgi:hypothetical protein
MMSLETMRDMAVERAGIAAEQSLTPYLVRGDELDEWRSGNYSTLPFPNIGDHRPDGWEMVDSLFCDSSGIGQPDEPALTASQLINLLEIGYGYAIIQEGQFQLYLGKFKPPYSD